MVDYSKWDNLELSDDSDIEVHPNVDKKSFIKWKQQDIHAKREERKQKIAYLQQQREMNKVLLSRMDTMISDIEKGGLSDLTRTIDDLRVKGKESNAPRPSSSSGPSFDEMMAALLMQVQDEIRKGNQDEASDNMLKKLREHRVKLQSHQDQCEKDLAAEEKDAKKHITTEDLKEGFNYSSVSKPTTTKKESHIEVLNPNAKGSTEAPTTTSEPVEFSKLDEDAEIKLSPSAKAFSEIKSYPASLEFISKHPDIVAPDVSDGILYEAFGAQLDGKETYAKQCVHQALLLQYCNKLGKDGVALFFQRITNSNHQAKQVFMADVEKTYAHIVTRCKVIKAEKGSGTEDVEQIQLQATDPNQTIAFDVPSAQTQAGDSEEAQIEQARWEAFQTFPPALQKAMQEGDLAKVNIVLGKMAVDEAEEVVRICGDFGFLNIHEGIIDATGEGGEQEALRKLKERETVTDVDVD